MINYNSSKAKNKEKWRIGVKSGSHGIDNKLNSSTKLLIIPKNNIINNTKQ